MSVIETGYHVDVMARTLPFPPPGFDELSTDEKIDYVCSLWNLIAENPEDVPVPDWHLEIVQERLAEYRANPKEENLPAEEVDCPLSMSDARDLAEDWQRRLAGRIKGDSSELIREDRER